MRVLRFVLRTRCLDCVCSVSIGCHVSLPTLSRVSRRVPFVGAHRCLLLVMGVRLLLAASPIRPSMPVPRILTTQPALFSLLRSVGVPRGPRERHGASLLLVSVLFPDAFCFLSLFLLLPTRRVCFPLIAGSAALGVPLLSPALCLDHIPLIWRLNRLSAFSCIQPGWLLRAESHLRQRTHPGMCASHFHSTCCSTIACLAMLARMETCPPITAPFLGDRY